MLIGSAHGNRANFMPQETIPFDEIVAGASARLAVIAGFQCLSVRDLIMHFCGLSNRKRATEKWGLLSEEAKKEVAEFVHLFQFPGQGNKPEPVITFKGALKLVMLVSGQRAALYRSAMVNILQRYYAGDGSLVEEVEANAQSAGPVQQMARASLVASEAVQEEEALDLPFKKRRMELAMAREEAEVKARQIANRVAEREHLSQVVSEYRALCLDKEMDERARLILKDNVLNMAMMMGGSGQALLSDGSSKPISLSMVADEMRLKLSTPELISLGQELKKRYVELHGKPPSKHEQLCGGRVTLVNTYMESDRPLVEEVLRWHADGRPLV